MPGAPHKPAAMYGITRGKRGWKVQLKRNGVTLFKQFGFKMHQGEEPALLRARAWRDLMIKKHPPVPRRDRAETLRRNNTTGIPGVACRLGPDGKPKAWLVQTYIAKGTMLRKCFSVGHYGSEAKLLAIAERQKHLRQMSGLTQVHPAESSMRTAPRQPLPLDCPPPLARREVIRSTNKSGIPGVSHRQSNPEYPGSWIATTYAGNGKFLTANFSIREHGEERAKELAIAQRMKQLRQVARNPRPPLSQGSTKPPSPPSPATKRVSQTKATVRKSNK